MTVACNASCSFSVKHLGGKSNVPVIWDHSLTFVRLLFGYKHIIYTVPHNPVIDQQTLEVYQCIPVELHVAFKYQGVRPSSPALSRWNVNTYTYNLKHHSKSRLHSSEPGPGCQLQTNSLPWLFPSCWPLCYCTGLALRARQY
jgi:hypothetical protein